jgi:hypothetical protein
LVFEKCVCPKGFFLGEIGNCIECDSSCNECGEGGICLECK